MPSGYPDLATLNYLISADGVDDGVDLLAVGLHFLAELFWSKLFGHLQSLQTRLSN
jgi:hypothetical protein